MGAFDDLIPGASSQPSTGAFDDLIPKQADQDNPLARGIKHAVSSAKTAAALTTGDYDAAANLATERDTYAKRNPGSKEGNELMQAWESGDGVMGGIKGVAGEFAKDWNEAPSTIDALRETGKNLAAMGGGLVEQVPNMVMPMAGLLAGGAAGAATPVPGGAAIGAFGGAAIGNAATESAEQVDRALREAQIDPQDTAAVRSFLEQNGGSIAGQALTKGAVLGAADTVSAGLGHMLLTGPAKAATNRALAGMGVDMADQAAVKAATQSTEFATRLANDATYQATLKGANKVARNAGAFATEPAGEFVGEYFGQGVATGDWDEKGAALEALSSMGQSGITFAGQKFIEYVTRPKSGEKTDAKEEEKPTNPLLALPSPTYTGTPSDQLLMSQAERQRQIDEADANAAAIYEARAAYEAAQRELSAIRLTTDPAPLQQRIDELLGIGKRPVPKGQQAAYEKALAEALNEPVGITHDANGIEIPLTIGAYLDAQVEVADKQRMLDAAETMTQAGRESQARLDQLADEETQTQPDIQVVGPLSAAAKQAVDSGVAAYVQTRKALEDAPKPIDGGESNGQQSRQQANAGVAAAGAQGAGGNVSGSGNVLVSAPSGDAGTVVNRAEVAASSVRPAVPAGTSVDAGVVRSYPMGQARMIAGRMTKQGLPSEIYPHPKQPGMYAIRPIGEDNANRPEPTRSQPPIEAPAEQPAAVAPIPAATTATPEAPPVEIKPVGANPIMRRDDLVGAIMRVTGGRGIAANMAQTLTGDTANRATKLRGLFTNQGQQDMDDLAMLLREEEAYNIRDGVQLEEMIREAAGGNVAVSMARQERDAAEAQEKQYRDSIRKKAKKYGFKTVAVKFSELEKIVLARMEERHNKAIAELDDRSLQRFNAALEEAMTLIPEEVVDETLTDVNRRGLHAREFWNEATRILRAMIYDAKQEAANGTATATEAIGDGRGNQGVGRGTSADQRDQAPAGEPTESGNASPAEEARPDLALQGQTPAEIRAQEAQRQADEARANRTEPDTSPRVKADQVDLFNTQGGLFNSNRDAPVAQVKEKTIAELQEEIRKSDPFSLIGSDLNGQLIKRVSEDAQQAIDSGIAPTYETGQGTFVVIHPSAQNEGMIQVTRYSDRGVFGDSQYNTMESAIRDNVLWMKTRMSQAEAEKALGQSLEAEAEYQRKRQEAEQTRIDTASAPVASTEQAQPEQTARGEVGASLSKEQRKEVLKTLVDVYKANNAPKEFKGQDRNGNDRYGYAHSPEFFVKSDITGAMVRYFVTLPDGRIAHPTELFADYTQSDIDAAMQQDEAAERQKQQSDESRLETLKRRTADSLNEANRKFNIENRGRADYVPAILTNGKQFIRTSPDSVRHDLELLGDGWSEQESVDAAAHEAATSPQNDTPEPTEAQKEAGNYKVGRVKIAGLDISIENPEGSTRSGTDPNGNPWSITMQSHYGYIRKTEDRDGDHVDVFVKPGTVEDYAGTVFVIDQRKANSHFDEHKVMLGWPSEEEAKAAYLANYSKGWTGLGAITPMTMDEFKSWVDSGDQKNPLVPKRLPERVAANKQKKQAENAERAAKLAAVMEKRKEASQLAQKGTPKASEQAQESSAIATPGSITEQADSIELAKIEDFGEKIGGSRKDKAAMREMLRERSDDEIASLPLSKIWPAEEIDKIEDTFAAAVAYAARSEIPSKPRTSYKLKRWVETVKNARQMVADFFGRFELSREKFIEKTGKYSALRDKFIPKVTLLEQIDRAQWRRIEEVSEHPDAFRYGDNSERIPSPFVAARIDGKSHTFDGARSVADVIEKINVLLGNDVQAKRMQFEVRGRGSSFSINKKGDSEYRKLKTFSTTKDAFDFIKNNYDELVAAWEGVKARDNVKETDVRNDENRPRKAKDWRNGKDVTTEEFKEKFGFRGGEFGKWVSQGSGAKDRQWMLNQAHDALMDLSDILGIPPKAVSLNGSLGIAFGARGSGNASAHYEPDTVVINLTKTKGAGTLAHEWFHALDNYFSRQRGGEAAFTGDQNAYRRDNYITYKPEPMFVHKTQRSTPTSRARLEQLRAQNPNAEYLKSENWHSDPKHKEGVRPEVERSFADLVEALDASPMANRSRMNDKSADGYWSRIIERGARAFENYVIHKMALNGSHNDYLANVRSAEDFPRNKERYPYLLENEMQPVAEAFDSLFQTIETKETENGVALQEESAVYTVNEPDPITGDLFQGTENALPASAGKNSLRPKPGATIDRAKPRAVLAVREAPDTEGLYNIQAQLVTVGERHLPVATINSPEDAARAFAHLTRFAVEHMDGLVTDKDGKPLAVIGALKGAPTNASVYPSTILMELSRIDGAANLWLSHNHPSGVSVLSDADRRIAELFEKTLKGTSVAFRGLSAMARTGDTISWMDSDYNNGSVSAKEDAPHRVAIVEREIVESNPGAAISSASDAKRLVAEIAKDQPGILFVTAQNQVASFVPFDPPEMGELRSGDRLMRLFRAAARSGGTGAIVAMPDGRVLGSEFSNVKGALEQIDVRVLDGIEYSSDGRGKAESLAEKGLDLSAGPSFFNRAGSDKITPADKAIYGMVAEGRSAADVLGFIAKTSRNPFYRQLAKLLTKTGISPTLTLDQTTGWKFAAGQDNKYAAAYNPKTDSVALFRPASAERNVLHELMHAATLKALQKKGLAATQMRALFQHVAKSGKLQGMYGMSNVDEFVAEAFSNPKFQQALKKVSAPTASSSLSNAWHWFVRVVRGILGIQQGQENALSRALEIGVELMRENMGIKEAATGDARPANGRPITDTPEFRKWFGDSKVVGEDGRPLVVYHGTAKDFSVFDFGRSGESTGNTGFYGSGSYFSQDAEDASAYASWARRLEDDATNVMPVYLSIQNPLYIHVNPKDDVRRNKARASVGRLVDQLVSEGYFGKSPNKDEAGSLYARLTAFVEKADFERAMGTLYNELKGGQAVTELAKRAGFDGVMVDAYKRENNILAEVVAFRPEQIKSAIGNIGQFDPSNPDIRYNVADEGWSVSEPSKMDDVIYALQDKHIDTKRVIQSIMKAGKKIADAFNPYLQEELFHGRAAKGVKDFLDLELRPLLAEMQRNGVDMGDFEEYLWNRHAPERNAQIAKINPEMKDGGSGIKTADAKAYLDGLSPEKKASFDALAKRIDAINRNSREILVSSGLEKQETIDAWNSAYKHYVPLQREDVDSGHVGTGKGFSVRGSSSERAMGSGKQVVDIIANITMQRERNIVRAEKNRVSNALMGLALQNENADFWQVDKAPKERVVNEKAIYTVIDADGKKVDEFTRMADAEKALKDVENGYIEQTWGDRVEERVIPGFTSRDNVILTRVNGEDHYIIFNERNERAMRMAASLKNLDADNLGRVLSLVGKATRYLASVNTQYNPVFGVINLIRDAQGALLNLSSTPLAGEQKRVLGYTKDALVGIYKDIRAHRAGKKPSSNWAELFEEFQREGGQTGYRDQYANAEQRAEAIRDELKQFSEGKAKQLTRGVFGWLSDYNETMENAVRLAAYKAAKEKGISNQQAASLAKNITVNFNRKGQMATQVGALYAFFNASVQGTARIAGTLFESNDGDLKTVRLSKVGKKILAGGIMLGSMQAMLLAAAGYDDDEPPDFVRERNLILPVGGGKYLTLAMPLGFHVIPGIGRIATEFVLSGGKDPIKRMAALASMFSDTFNPIGNAGFSLQSITPSVVDPFAALAENKDFTGKQIYREDFNLLNPQTGNARAKDVATFYSKMISASLNWITGGSEFRPGLISWSPDAIDYLIGQATGGVGRELNKAFQTGTSAATGEDLPLYKVPLVGRFVGDTEGQSGQSQKFYEGIRKLNTLEAEYKGLIKEGRSKEAKAFLNENPSVRLMMAGNYAENQIRKMKDQKRALLNDSADAGQIKAIDSRITDTMRKFNDRLASVT